jgi:hypothetical protein
MSAGGGRNSGACIGRVYRGGRKTRVPAVGGGGEGQYIAKSVPERRQTTDSGK